MFPVIPAGGSSAYNLQRSLRLRASASAYLSRTPGVAGNRNTWTWSGWVKRGILSARSTLFSVVDSTGHASFQFESDNTLIWNCFTAANGYVQTSAVLRDPSAHYHVVLAFNDTLATSTDRVKVFVNGMQQTFSVYTAPTQNQNTPVSNTVAQYLGVQSNLGGYFDGLLSEVNFIDGQALDASYFGATDPATGQWQPKKYTGTYGTNGFYLPFTDNSALTTSSNVGLGKDFSGNGNYWTTNNISLTAGATYDSFTDVPTLTGPTASNFATLNPLLSTGSTFANGNLQVTTPVAGNGLSVGTVAVSSGKYYWEVTYTNQAGGAMLGVALADTTGITYVGETANSYGYYNGSGFKYNSSTSSAYGATYTVNDVIGVALDLIAGTLTFYINNVSQGVAFSGLSGSFVPAISDGTGGAGSVFTVNFGQQPFAYTPPTGFLCLNTFNLPDPVIKKPNQFFDVSLITGTGSPMSVVNSGAMQPDLLWLKTRSIVDNHYLTDSVRGSTNNLFSNLTNAETTYANFVTSYNSNGFTLGTTNFGSGVTATAWQWKKGATPGFDVVAYTGNAANRTISHALGVAPKLMIIKDRTAVNSWWVWHQALAATDYLALNTMAATATVATLWNSTAPTSAGFSLGVSSEGNTSGDNYIAYLWSEVPGFSKFGSYTGNGSADGPFVYCGFRPKFVMVKRTDSTSDWLIYDVARSTYNAMDSLLFPDSSAAEANGNGNYIDVVSAGFKIRVSSAQPALNASSGTYIYAAFAEAPTKFANAR